MQTNQGISVKGLIRDEKTKMVINTNLDDYHKMVRERKQTETLSTLQNDVLTMKKELENIKKIVMEFIK